MTTRRKLVPMIVACPLFLQNIDLSAITVALPSVARSLHVPPLHLSAAIASYAISLAAFLPLSAWLADRFGTKRMFCSAILIFAAASALCGVASSATMLVLFRVLQGFGAAMMVPVGRLILIRSVPREEFMLAMVWFTIPPAIGRLLGPLVGGAIVTFASWRWIFFVNIPLGLLAVIAAVLLIDPLSDAVKPPRFDVLGFLTMATGLGLLLAGLETLGRHTELSHWSLAMVAGGAILLVGYGWYSLRREHPVIDLRILRYHTYRTNVLGAFPLRLANSAVPFLVPLMLQLGFGFSALTAGLVAAGSAVGSITTRVLMKRAMERLSFRNILIASTAATGIVFAAYGLFSPAWPHLLMFLVVLLGGLVSSLCMVSLNTLGFVDIPRERTSHATALVAMAQQVTSALGVVLAASSLAFFSWTHAGDGVHLVRADFSIAFVLTGLMALVSLIPFWRLPADGGVGSAAAHKP